MLTIINKTHLYWEQISSQTNQQLDYMTLIKLTDNTDNIIENKKNLNWLWITLGVVGGLIIIITILYFIK